MLSSGVLLFSGGPVMAQSADSLTVPFQPIFAVSAQIGTDIGGAIPVPFSAVGGSLNAYPKLNAAFGVRLLLDVHPRWSLGANINYKTVAMEADARVTNQKFKGENTVQFFTGTTEMSMSFTFLELPVYVDFFLGPKKIHAVQAGLFGAYSFKSKFQTRAMKGFIGSEADRVDSGVTEPQVMDFSALLTRWDVGVLFGYETRITPRIRAGLLLMFGFRDLFQTGNDFFDYKMHQVRGSVVLSYDIFRLYQR